MADNEQQSNQTTEQPKPNNERRGGGPGGERRGPGAGTGGGRREGQGGGPRTDRGDRGDRGERGGDRGIRDRRFEGPPEIDLEKLIGDSLYLDNQAHAVVARMRDMDSGTKSQLRRFYNAVRRACRTAEPEKQHQFVMLRARLAYTIARHQLRSLDTLEKLLLQVTRKNESKGYDRFRDLFEAIVAYNE
jgi:CRISPR type III-A-associated protein Csm2